MKPAQALRADENSGQVKRGEASRKQYADFLNSITHLIRDNIVPELQGGVLPPE